MAEQDPESRPSNQTADAQKLAHAAAPPAPPPSPSRPAPLSANNTPSDARRTPEVEPPSIPDHELLCLIGRGAYGQVWFARNVLGDQRAIKVIYRGHFDSDHAYEREFQGLKCYEPISLGAPGLVAILHVGRNDTAGFYYYVMELADPVLVEERTAKTRDGAAEQPKSSSGQPLSPGAEGDYRPRTLKNELVRRQRLPVDACVQVGLALTTALEHLHRHGLIHRDIKPSNVIFVNGMPKLADIGLVAPIDAAMSFVGTEGYIPPEGPGQPQADLYSLGKLLYEAATGRDRRDFPALPDDLAEDEPMLELNAVILKACKGDPRERYRTAEEMEADLALLEEGKSVKQRRKWQGRRSWLNKVALLACGITLIAMIFPNLVRRRSRDLTPIAQTISVGVFPFHATGTNAQHNARCERIADGLTAALGQLPGLKLAPRQWAYSLTDQEPDPMRFAAALHLDELVGVCLSNTGGQSRLDVTLAHVAGGQRHWADTLSTNRADLLAVQLRIVESVAHSLGLILDQNHRQQIQERLERTLGAYELVQLARRSWGHRREDFTRQIDLYSQAIAQDPNYVMAHLELAYVYRNMSDDLKPAREAMPEMQNYVRRALDLDSTHPKVYHHLAAYKMCYEWNWDEAQTLFRRQKDITGRWDRSYAGWLESQGRFDEALAVWEANLAKAPDTQYNWGFGNHFFLRRDFGRALTETLKIVERYPNTYDTVLARCYEELGRYAEALAAVRKTRALTDGPGPMAVEGHILARMGRQTEARERLDELSGMSRFRYVSPVFPAVLHVALGDLDAAFAWLEKAYEDRSECMTFSQSFGLGVDPYWDPLRRDPRFTNLLRRVGLAERLAWSPLQAKPSASDSSLP